MSSFTLAFTVIAAHALLVNRTHCRPDHHQIAKITAMCTECFLYHVRRLLVVHQVSVVFSVRNIWAADASSTDASATNTADYWCTDASANTQTTDTCTYTNSNDDSQQQWRNFSANERVSS
jgi:hypothetical protein